MRDVEKACKIIEEELDIPGKFYELENMNAFTKKALIEMHLLFR